MAMMYKQKQLLYDYTGVVEKILDTQTFASGFMKRDLIVTDDAGRETHFPQHLPFTFKKDGVNMLNNIKVGDRVKVRFAIDGREWTNPQGQTKYFVDLTGLKIDVLNFDGTSTEPVPEPAVPDEVMMDAGEVVDDLPF